MTPKPLQNHRVQWSVSKKLVNGNGQRVAKPSKIHQCQWFSRKKNIPSHRSQKMTIAHLQYKTWSGEIMILIMMAMIENMISPDYVLCYIPRSLEVPWNDLEFRKEAAASLISVATPLCLWFCKFSGKFWNLFWNFWKIACYNFQSRRPIMREYWFKMTRGAFSCFFGIK